MNFGINFEKKKVNQVLYLRGGGCVTDKNKKDIYMKTNRVFPDNEQ